MQKILPLLAFALLTINAHSQSDEDYSKIVDVLATSYNTNDSTLIASHYNQELKSALITQKAEAFVAEDEPVIFPMNHENDGKIIATDLIMTDADSKVYYVEFEKSAKILTLALSESKEITAMQLEDY